MTRVSSDVPPFVILVAARGPRSEIRMINGVGLQRNGFTAADIAALKGAFMKLFSRRARMSGKPIRDRVQSILNADKPSPCVVELCDFLMRSFAHGRHGRYLESLRADPVHRGSWNFDNKYTLTVNVVGNGSVRKTASADRDKNVYELTAAADPGWTFSGWNGNLSGKNNPESVVLDSNKTVDVTFTRAS